MNKMRTAGILWIVSALAATGMTLVFRDNPIQLVVTIAAAIVAAALGFWIIARPSNAAVLVSNVVGVAWLVLYAWLTIWQSGELAAWTTDVFLALIGLGAAFLAYRGTRGATSQGSQ